MCWSRALALGLALVAAGFPPVQGQQRQASGSRPAADAGRPDVTVLQALQGNPYTAPYRIGANWRDGRLVLSGRVGTKQIHDVALRVALVYTSAIRDDLVIDTAEAHRVAAQGAAGPAVRSPAVGMPSLGAMPYTLGSLPYVYPPPLFGRLDDPFFGFEPPLASYPPWWGAVAAREYGGAPAPAPAAVNPTGTAAEAVASLAAPAAATPPGNGTVEMTIDSRGVATLRGTVNNLADRIAVGQQIAQTPGVSEVINLLDVKAPAASASRSSAVPPPPQPAFIPGVKAEDAPAPRPAIAVDAGNLTPRLTDALARRPALAGLAIRVTLQDGAAELSGRVPTVYEAMLAFRAVQQTPGVDRVVDRLQFEVPDGEAKNPLLTKGRPDDVEPYLAAQLARQLGDMAHVDQVRVRADTLQIRGTLAQPEDRPRLDAIIRSMAILRGFQVTSSFSNE